MKNAEIIKRINNVKNELVESETFMKERPPEEFGDAVKLFYNSEEQTFKAVVYDPDTKIVFSEKSISDENKACTFIENVLEGREVDD